jgi:hypothetical protein
MFDDPLARWELVPDGAPIVTRSSRLLPVRRHGVPAMLKVAVAAEERFESALMAWWDGKGAARVARDRPEAPRRGARLRSRQPVLQPGPRDGDGSRPVRAAGRGREPGDGASPGTALAVAELAC